MTEIKELSRLELAALIADTLASKGIDVVLTGGSCVSIYSKELYVSLDLDFIDVSLSPRSRIVAALGDIGFSNHPKNSRHFVHPDSSLSVEFPSGPLAIGDEQIEIQALEAISTDFGILRLLNPTDCVKDRLANYYYFKDRQCLEQALMVARTHPVSLTALREWHEREGVTKGFAEFASLLEES